MTENEIWAFDIFRFSFLSRGLFSDFADTETSERKQVQK